jgi:phosphoglycerol transferase MdoB-like AlkP superfamily enzyme
VLAGHLALILILYSVCRLAFFVYNRDLFAETTGGDLLVMMAGGLRFDLSAALYTNLLYIQLLLLPFEFRHHPTYQKVALGVFWLTNGLALSANCGDVAYYPFNLKRTTAAVFEEFAHEGQMATILLRALADFWPLTLFWLTVLTAMVLGTRVLQLDRTPPALSRRFRLGAGAVLFVALNTLAVVGMRGGFFTRSHRPITNSNAGAYVSRPSEMAIVLNTPFSVIRTIDKNPLRRRQTFSDETALEAIYSPVHRADEGATPRRDNIVILVLESFSTEFVGALNRDLDGGTYFGYTPFFDTLVDRSLTFTHAYANGHKSIDALPAITASIPYLAERFVLSHYYSNQLETLPALLERIGYDTAFFHGAPDGSMGFAAFANVVGFDAYYGMNAYGSDDAFDGAWGIWDEEFLGFTAERLGELEEPFFATVFTLSSHHPFDIPARYQDRFPEGPKPIHRVIRYSDYALQRFFEAAEKMPWFEHTLFVLTADHASPMIGRPEYNNTIARFRVPILLFKPSDPQVVGRDDEVAQQIDIMPTVLGWVGFAEDYVAFGANLLDSDAERFAVNYRGSQFQLVSGTHALLHDGVGPFGLYDLSADPSLETNLVDSAPRIRARLQRKLEAIVQQFSNRMLDNRLTAVTEPRR